MKARSIVLVLVMLGSLASVSSGYTLSGDITGAEWLGGITYVYAMSLSSLNPDFYIGLVLTGNGPYIILDVPEGDYILVAFQDRDNNLVPSIDDYLGYYGGDFPISVEVMGNVENLDIVVEPLPFTTISGTVTCSGEYFGPTYIIAATDPSFVDISHWIILFDLTGNAEYTLFADPGQYYVMAYLDADFSFSRTSDDPQTFYGAPGYPILLDVSFSSAENIDLPLLAPPELILTLGPQGPPIIIPPGGGSFDYTIGLQNTGTDPAVVQFWCDATLPNGTLYGPVLGPVGLILPAGFSGDRDRSQAVPGAAPAGMYSYNAYAGVYPAIVWESDSIPFEKLAGGDASPTTAWTSDGEPLDKLLADTHNEQSSGLTVLGAYPNPFNPTTTISYQLPVSGLTRLNVYDVQGRLVAMPVNGWREAGMHEVTFDGSSLASGIYLYRIEAGDYTAVNKMVLMK